MKKCELQEKLDELGTILGAAKPCSGKFPTVESMLDLVRLLAKYQRFDLEATQRELKFMKDTNNGS